MFKMFRGGLSLLLCIVVGLAWAGVAAGGATTQSAQADPLLAEVSVKGPLLMHLPGIGGYLWCDHQMLSGLRDAGVSAHVVVYDWTGQEPGIHALQAYQHNQVEAEKVAHLIAAHAAVDPKSPICITAHSGGCAIAVWALQDLASDVKVQTVLLLAPALSPKYDLSAALRHVTAKMYVFYSPLDTLVLYTGTRLFGTMDRVKTAAAGFSGFVAPPGADPAMYRKLDQRTYQSDWVKYNDYGNHIGTMSRPFAAAVLAPLLRPMAPTTQVDAGPDASRSGG
jgi:Serine hydrolase